MPYLVIENFAAGLDARRHPMMAPVGSLRRADNTFLTRGGELQKRRAFVPWKTLPANTRGLAVAQGVPYVFGSIAPPVMPAGVQYQRLQHPGGQALQDVLSWDVYGGKLYVVARFADGSLFHFYDGVRVTDWYDGRARTSFTVVSGHDVDIPNPGDPASQVTSVTVAGIEILGVSIAWDTDAATTAQAIVDQINTFASIPEYTASRNGNIVNIVASDAGAAANGRAVHVTAASGMTVNPINTVMAGGVDSSGTYPPGTFVKTVQTKMYSVSGSLLHFSGVEQPTKWNSVTGAGFINMANEDGQSQNLVSMERYYNRLAVFARHNIQIWNIDVDPAKNAQAQTLRNTGLIAANSVEQFGDNDVFYLSDSGIRSLRARDSSTAAAVNDIGVPVDELIVQRVAEVGPAVVDRACSIIDMGGRYWLVIGDRVYVFTQYPGSKVAGWTTFSPGMVITEMIMIGNQVHVRSGDVIYRYGGASGDEYDLSLCEVDLPLLFMEKPASFKTFSAIDVICEGTWRVYAGFEPLRLDAMEHIATINSPTPSMQRISLAGYGTHANVRFQSDDGQVARLSSFMLHYELADAG